MKLAASKSRVFTGISLLLVLLLAACSSPAATPTPVAVPQQNVTASGSGGATTVVKYLANAYSQNHHDLAFSFLSGAGTSAECRCTGRTARSGLDVARTQGFRTSGRDQIRRHWAANELLS